MITDESKDHTTQLNEFDNHLAKPLYRLKLVEYIYGGFLWDFWICEHPLYGKVISKIVDTFDHPCSIPDLDDNVACEDIIKQAIREQEFYNGPLLELQGEVVPRYFGIYTAGRKDQYLAMVLGFAGYSLETGVHEFNHELLSKICDAYKQIHLCGVSHWDIEDRHILVNDQRQIQLVGFRRSVRQDVTTVKGVLRLLQEAACVRGRFELHDTPLAVAGAEYWARLRNPAAFKANLDRREARRGFVPPIIRQLNARFGFKYTEDGREIRTRK
ncbi:uncharacterized protein L201_002856 [Kwoniella dendrophila CBS 6074]|uniref:Protein kinase domain-containing protein n=1 Tax=Kwoniella dendrophila CBS 6074 TaxID=1295534 RepID=A0AAX4JRD3_9TREE